MLDSHYQPTTDGDYSNLDNEVVDPLVSMEPHRNQQIADDEKSASVAAIKAFLMSGQPLIDSRPTIEVRIHRKDIFEILRSFSHRLCVYGTSAFLIRFICG